MSRPKRTIVLPAAHQAFLDAAFTRNRTAFGGFTMEHDGGDGGSGDQGDGNGAPGADGGDGGSGDQGDGNGAPGADGGDGGAQDQGGDQGDQGGADGSNGTDDQQAGQGDGNDLDSLEDVEALRKMVKDLRKENGAQRTKRTAAEAEAEQKVSDAIKSAAVAAGLIKADDEGAGNVTVEELTTSLTTAQTELRNARTESAVLRLGGKHGANTDALLDRVSFQKTLNSLDPAADDFAANVETAITAALEADASLKKAPAAGTGGTELGGGQGGDGGKPDPNAMTPDDFIKQRNERLRG